MHVKIGFITPTTISLAHLLFPNAYQTTSKKGSPLAIILFNLVVKKLEENSRRKLFQKDWANSDLKARQIPMYTQYHPISTKSQKLSKSS